MKYDDCEKTKELAKYVEISENTSIVIKKSEYDRITNALITSVQNNKKLIEILSMNFKKQINK